MRKHRKLHIPERLRMHLNTKDAAIKRTRPIKIIHWDIHPHYSIFFAVEVCHTNKFTGDRAGAQSINQRNKKVGIKIKTEVLCSDKPAMPMTQTDIQTYYRDFWGKMNEAGTAGANSSLTYSSPIEDAVIYPIYERLIADHGIKIDQGNVLDIGTGAGRWIRFILDRFSPESILGIDFAESSVDLLNQWSTSLTTPAQVSFQAADITAPQCPVHGQYDLINIANVLFHIPETDKFEQALGNIACLLARRHRARRHRRIPPQNIHAH